MCPKCFGQGALAADTGWLSSTVPEEATADNAWPEVPGWRILGLLGAGGMGRVYRAEPEKGGEPWAVKVLDARWSRDPQMTARFEAEAAALMSLEHPHIVRVLELTETEDGRLCFVMELVDGCDLERLMRADRPGPARAVDIFCKVCSAVEHAHAAGFAHRDIKPANILAGRDGMVKLGDFGLVKKAPAEGAAALASIGGFTFTTDRFGTAYYVAPEILLRGRSEGTGADVYSLGVLLHHLLAGQMPIGNYTPVSQAAGLPRAFDRVIARALEADPARRTASVREMHAAVEAAWKEHLRSTDRVLQRRRWLLGAGAVMLAAGAALGGAWWQDRRMQPPQPAAYAAPGTATPARPWENSLGMRFVPVPGVDVLVSIWETRRRDVEPFIKAEKSMIAPTWRAEHVEKPKTGPNAFYKLDVGGVLMPTGSWDDPGYPVTPEHPAIYMTVRDAQRYCLWLTWKEQGEGRLQPGQRYRLPTNAEWLAACGGEDAALRPGNRAGPEARDERWPAGWPTFKERDPFPGASPAGSFPAEAHGLFDLSGNVTEWVMDEDENTGDLPSETAARLRGPAFNDGRRFMASFAYVRPMPDKVRLPNIGFRVVLDWKE